MARRAGSSPEPRTRTTTSCCGFTEVCLANVLRLETYVQDADGDGDSELTQLFTKAEAESRKGAEQAKQLLRSGLDS